MSIIGDALNRAEEANRLASRASEPTPSVGHRLGDSTSAQSERHRADAKPQEAESIWSSAHGIAHPAPTTPVKPQRESPVFGIVLLSLLGLAGYLIVYPSGVDSLWNFESSDSLTAPHLANSASREKPANLKSDVRPTPLKQAAPESSLVPPAIREPSVEVGTQRSISSPRRRPFAQRAPRSISKLPIQTEPRRTRFQVDGVMLGGRRTLAVVNGAIVGVGDDVDGATVRAIVDNAVALEIDGRIRRIPLRAPTPAGDTNAE